MFRLRRRERIEGRTVQEIVGNRKQKAAPRTLFAHSIFRQHFIEKVAQRHAFGAPWSSLLRSCWRHFRAFCGTWPMICPGRIKHLVLKQK